MDSFLLSVCMITYNHSKYVAEAIEGVLVQSTSFNYELVIVDDCSTDNTDFLIKYLINTHISGNKIRYMRQELNLGVQLNLRFALEKCNGKYVAVCEGDDYWTDPNKLQKQIDFLEDNKDYAICFHEAKILREDRSESLYNNIEQDKTFTFLDLVLSSFISTASCVFRNYGQLHPLPAWFTGTAAGDRGLNLLNASYGKIYYMKDCMSVYRQHSGGVWSSYNSDQMYEAGVAVNDALNAAFEYKYHEYFEKGKAARRERFYGVPHASPPPRSLIFRMARKIKNVIRKPVRFSL